MTPQESLLDQDLNDPAVIEELLRIEEECGYNFSVGRFGDRPSYWYNMLHHPGSADRIEGLKALVREELEADETITDAQAFGDQHFQRPTSKILNILSMALDCQNQEAQRAKIRDAIALARSHSMA